MSDELIFYTHPMSRGRTIRWLLEEVGVPYRTEILDFQDKAKSPEYLALNPMGKVPAIVHNGKVVTETAAICLYVADAFPDAGLAPALSDRADYYRWMLFMAGPVEAAFTDKMTGLKPAPDLRAMIGYGHYDLAINTLEAGLKGKRYICGDRFTVADLYLASVLHFMIGNHLADDRQTFSTYLHKHANRPAWVRARAIDDQLIAEMLKR